MSSTLVIGTTARPLTDAWRLDCIAHWAQSTEFWARYLDDCTMARNGLNQSYARLGEHLHYLMRADSRPEY